MSENMNQEIIAIGLEHVMPTYNRFPIVLEKGKGCVVFDTNGKQYLDFVAGIAVNALGHGHEKLTQAIAQQAAELIHVSNLYWNKPQVELARKLVSHSCFDKAFFCNSGAEAVEGSLKLARKYAYQQENTGGRVLHRTEIITMQHSFHGRTFGALTATGQTKYQTGFQPLLPGISHVPFNDFKALKAAVTDKTCAILLEPIQGEGGIRPAEQAFLQATRALCDEKGIALIFDEVQCGVGRTGTFFAFEQYGVQPDIAVLAKGMAGGVPIGVILAKKPFDTAFAPGDHAATFGGNPLATAAANVVADELFENGLLEQVREAGAYLASKLAGFKQKFSALIQDIRGLGLMQGMELSCPAASIVADCMDNGLLLVSAGAQVIRFVPPLIVSLTEIDEAMAILESALGRAMA
jgi:predicted acetylornithine/succinylornithine family transaminase